jgi:hypothetical protein
VFSSASESLIYGRNAAGVSLILLNRPGSAKICVSDLELGKKEVCLRTTQTRSAAFGVTVPELIKSLGRQVRVNSVGKAEVRWLFI